MISSKNLTLHILRHGFRCIRHTSSTPESSQLVLLESVHPGICLLTLNNEKRANCLSLSLIHELHSAIKQVKEKLEFRALVIRGAGNYFSSGHDLGELVGNEKSTKRAEVFSACSSMMLELTKLRIPSIAAVSGPAYAAGCQLVAACDMAVAGQSATFATPGIKIGLFCSTPAVALVRAIGLRPAKELLFTGRPINSSRAHELGLVNRVVPDDKVLESALELAREITQHSKPALTMGKRALAAQVDLDLPEAYDLATHVMLENLELEDTRNGIQAFLKKKPMPEWTHKKD